MKENGDNVSSTVTAWTSLQMETLIKGNSLTEKLTVKVPIHGVLTALITLVSSNKA